MDAQIESQHKLFFLAAFYQIFDLISQPVNTFTQTFSRQGVAGTNVPRFVSNSVQTHQARAFDTRHWFSEIYLVGKKQNRNASVLQVTVVKQKIQFVFGNHHAKFVAAVDDKDDTMTVTVVMFPQVTIPALAGHIKRCECERIWRKPFNIETHCGHDIVIFWLVWFEVVDNGCFAGIVQTNNKHAYFFLFYSEPGCQFIKETHREDWSVTEVTIPWKAGGCYFPPRKRPEILRHNLKHEWSYCYATNRKFPVLLQQQIESTMFCAMNNNLSTAHCLQFGVSTNRRGPCFHSWQGNFPTMHWSWHAHYMRREITLIKHCVQAFPPSSCVDGVAMLDLEPLPQTADMRMLWVCASAQSSLVFCSFD